MSKNTKPKPKPNAYPKQSTVAKPKPAGEQEVYAAIVDAVKAEAAKKPEREVSGDWVSYEIAKRWAAHNARPFKQPAPDGPGGLGSTAVSPPDAGDESGGTKIELPGDKEIDEAESTEA